MPHRFPQRRHRPTYPEGLGQLSEFLLGRRGHAEREHDAVVATGEFVCMLLREMIAQIRLADAGHALQGTHRHGPGRSRILRGLAAFGEVAREADQINGPVFAQLVQVAQPRLPQHATSSPWFSFTRTAFVEVRDV